MWRDPLVRSGGTGLARGRLLLLWLLFLGAVIVALALWHARGGGTALGGLARTLLVPFSGLADLALAPISGLPAWGLPALAALALLGGGSLVLLVDRFAAVTEPGRDAASLGDGRAAGADWTLGVGRFRGERAIAWKTLLALRRSVGRLAVVIGVGTAGLAAAALLGSPRLLLVAGPATFLLYYGLLAEPLFGLFVADLERGDLLRPLPLRPGRVLLGSLGLLTVVGILAGWIPLLVAWPLYGPRTREWLAVAAALAPLVVPLVFLTRGLLITLFPPQREAETLDMFYAAAVELAALFLGLVTVTLPILVFVILVELGCGVVVGWLAAAVMAGLVGLPLGWGLLRAYRGRGPTL